MTNALILDEDIDQLSHRFRIALEAGPVKHAVERRLHALARSARVPGFRPGRAPITVLRRRHGESLRHAEIDRMAIAVTRNLVAERGLQPVRRPAIRIEESAEGAPHDHDIVFSLLFEVAPRFELGRLDDIALERWQVPDADEALAEQSDMLLRRRLFDVLTERYDFAVPSDMAENEYARIVQGYAREVGAVAEAELASDLRRIAERRIRLAILLTEVGRRHGIEVPRSEVETLVERQAEREPQHQAEVIDYYLDHPAALAELQSPLFEDKVVEYLLAQSHVRTIEVTADVLADALEQT